MCDSRWKPGVLFDVDGVLVHPPMQFRDYLVSHHNITPEMTAPFFGGRFKDCLIGKADLAEELGVYLEAWQWPGTVGSFIETWMQVDSTPDPAMMSLVVQLRGQGFKCYVASVQERNRARYLRQTIGFDWRFDETFFSCEIGAAKPDPAFYLKVREQLDRPPHELLLVDDSQECVEAARRVGWKAWHYEGPADLARLTAEFNRWDSIEWS